MLTISSPTWIRRSAQPNSPICNPFGGPMPVYINGKPSNDRPSDGPCINIGLINNMPDSALETTEREFLALLNSAAAGKSVHLSLYALSDVPRSEVGRSHVSRFYSNIE